MKIDGTDVYLGPHGSKASRVEYDRVVTEWLANGRSLPDKSGLTIVELAARYMEFAVDYRWSSEMVVADGVHLSEAGQRHMGRELLEFFSRNAQAATWFRAGTRVAPSPVLAAGPAAAKFANPAGSYKVELKGEVTSRRSRPGRTIQPGG